jgi:predicted transcriptional regulator
MNEEVRWICESLGLVSGRDVNDTSFKVLSGILKEMPEEKLVATDDLARWLNLEAPTVNHHVRNFMESGIVFREKRKIALRGGSLTAALEEMKRESNEMFDRLIASSKRIDDSFEL